MNIIKYSNDKINISIENNDFNDINEIKELLIKEKNNNKILVEEIKKLENNLNLEKDKNILLEKNNIDLKKKLENEIKKYNNLIEKLEEEKPIKRDWNKLNEIAWLDLSIISFRKDWNDLVEDQTLDEIFIKGCKKVSLKRKLDNDNNEILLTLIKKDKEIEELKLKLSRFPFILGEGENLL